LDCEKNLNQSKKVFHGAHHGFIALQHHFSEIQYNGGKHLKQN
jgi:hypothetical protein